MKTKIYFPALFVLSFAWGVSQSQDIHFSQYDQAPLTLNPAKAGVFDGYFRVLLNYRGQWSTMGKPYRTFGASFDKPWMLGKKKKAYIGTGINMFSDRAGDGAFGMTEARLSVSAIVPMDDYNKVSVGLYGGAAQGSINFSALQWGNQYNGQSYDGELNSGETGVKNFIYGDFGAGAQYEYSNYKTSIAGKDIFSVNAGFAVFHVNTPKQEFLTYTTNEELEIKYVGHSSMRYDFPGSKMSVCPSVIYLHQGKASEINGGVLFRMQLSGGTKITGFFGESAMYFGANYRWKDAVVPQFSFETGKLAIGLSYDVNISTYAEASKYKGGLEVFIRIAHMRGALYKNKNEM